MREGAEGEKTDTVTRETWKRRFKKAHRDWPTYLTDSEVTAEVEWFKLSEEDRLKAAELSSVYVSEGAKIGRKKFCAFAVYLGEKRWERLSPQAAKVADGKRETAAPFGKNWGAQRFADLMRQPYGRMPPPTDFQKKLFAEGGPMAERERRERQANYGWPHVKQMHEWAFSRGHKGVAADPSVEPLEGLFGKVAKGSGIWEAWNALHLERGWPWFGSDDHCPDWIWMPATPSDPESYQSPQEAVRAAMARFETEHAALTQKDAAE
ncbi:hypothetical protein [Roseibium aggregatum]|uniref:hypothetical protein n=1 Tax=Roseibium aggregatum TaxID=187304 RepID=UPI001E4D715B|nr:hypothetical protein [Roseibium aggregatum]